LDRLAGNSLPEWKKDQLKYSKLNKICWKLKKGFQWNPILRYPRNALCWCGSGKKSKKCCLPNASMICKDKEVSGYKQLVNIANRPDQ
jgi:hypothetical protein